MSVLLATIEYPIDSGTKYYLSDKGYSGSVWWSPYITDFSRFHLKTSKGGYLDVAFGTLKISNQPNDPNHPFSASSGNFSKIISEEKLITIELSWLEQKVPLFRGTMQLKSIDQKDFSFALMPESFTTELLFKTLDTTQTIVDAVTFDTKLAISGVTYNSSDGSTTFTVTANPSVNYVAGDFIGIHGANPSTLDFSNLVIASTTTTSPYTITVNNLNTSEITWVSGGHIGKPIKITSNDHLLESGNKVTFENVKRGSTFWNLNYTYNNRSHNDSSGNGNETTDEDNVFLVSYIDKDNFFIQSSTFQFIVSSNPKNNIVSGNSANFGTANNDSRCGKPVDRPFAFGQVTYETKVIQKRANVFSNPNLSLTNKRLNCDIDDGDGSTTVNDSGQKIVQVKDKDYTITQIKYHDADEIQITINTATHFFEVGDIIKITGTTNFNSTNEVITTLEVSGSTTIIKCTHPENITSSTATETSGTASSVFNFNRNAQILSGDTIILTDSDGTSNPTVYTVENVTASNKLTLNSNLSRSYADGAVIFRNAIAIQSDGVGVSVATTFSGLQTIPNEQEIFTLQAITGEPSVTGVSKHGKTILEFFAYVCTRLKDEFGNNLILDSTKATGTTNLNIYEETQQKLLDFAGAVAKGTNHIFYIRKDSEQKDGSGNFRTVLYLIDRKHVPTTFHTFDYSKIIESKYKIPHPIAEYVTRFNVNVPYSGLVGADSVSRLVQEEKSVTVKYLDTGKYVGITTFSKVISVLESMVADILVIDKKRYITLTLADLRDNLRIGDRVKYTMVDDYMTNEFIIREIEYDFKNLQTVIAGDGTLQLLESGVGVAGYQ